jgi:hypothetical protein
LFVQSRTGDNSSGRARFLDHLRNLGVTPSEVTSSSVKQALRNAPVQEGEGGIAKKQHLSLKSPPGKRAKLLFMYR